MFRLNTDGLTPIRLLRSLVIFKPPYVLQVVGKIYEPVSN